MKHVVRVPDSAAARLRGEASMTPGSRGFGRMGLLVVLTTFALAVVAGQMAEASKKQALGRVVLYAAVGAELLQYDLDRDNAVLIRRGSVTLPANVQEAWVHPPGDPCAGGWQHTKPLSRHRATEVTPSFCSVTPACASVSAPTYPSIVSAWSTQIAGPSMCPSASRKPRAWSRWILSFVGWWIASACCAPRIPSRPTAFSWPVPVAATSSSASCAS